MTSRCIACGRRAIHEHHVAYAQWLRLHDRKGFVRLAKDARNLVPLCGRCHRHHHDRLEVIELAVLPDSVFEFAAEVFGPGLAYERLRRAYAGDDRRLDSLIEHSEEFCDRPAA